MTRAAGTDQKVRIPTGRNSLATLLLFIAVLAAVRAGFLFVRMELHTGVQRFHVESAVVLFVALSLISRALLQRPSAAAPERSVGVPPFVAVLSAVALAFLAYGSALHVGLLSDDWVLVHRVRSADFGAVSTGLFRPVPLLVWAALLKAGGGAPALHLLNIVVHGLNAFLVYRVVAGWMHDEIVSVAAALLFLLNPLAVEPVIWCSGVFDVGALFFCLSALLFARQETKRGFVLASVFAVLAMLSKESAVVLPGLLMVDLAIRQTATRRLAVLIGTWGLVSIAYASMRLLLAFGAVHPPLSKYVLQRALFNTFGALAVPLPSGLSPLWLALAGVLVILLTAYLLLSNQVDTVRPILLAAWCLGCIVPVYPILFVSPNLEGSRYLYESAVGWAALLGLAGFSRSRVVRVSGMSALCVLLAINVLGIRRQLQAWQLAAALRDNVQAAARGNGRMQRCKIVAVTDLPDSVLGAYVLRNGGDEVLKGAGLTVGAPAEGCRFSWSLARQQFIQREQ